MYSKMKNGITLLLNAVLMLILFSSMAFAYMPSPEVVISIDERPPEAVFADLLLPLKKPPNIILILIRLIASMDFPVRCIKCQKVQE